MRRSVTVGIAVALLVAFTLAGCGAPGGGPKPAAKAGQGLPSKPADIIPAPAGVVAITAPDQSDFMYIVAGNGRSKGIFKLNLVTRQITKSASTSNDVDSAVLTSAGTLALLGQGAKGTGSVILVDTSTLKSDKVIPVSGPVVDVATEMSQPGTVYVLTATKKAENVAEVDIASGRTIKNIPVALNTLAIAANGGTLYALLANGDIEGFSISSAKPQFQFGNFSQPIAFTVSPDGQRAYVLKKVNGSYEVSIVDLATEAQTSVIGAPEDGGTVALSQDGKTLYVGVCNPKVGNVQVFDLAE